uniref:Glycosyl transferases group 1 n=1 Tax=Candidatus Kentrum sp. LFY TaxID=2126342 RepID=A0A450U7Q2_9GAMM|nr:MAG: Glycosyl transferases group 1 [Candidatus Kentron sp. LFY]
MSKGEQHWWWKRPFLYIGRMAEDKGVVEILKAWLELKARFSDDCPPLWLIGGLPSEIESVRSMVGWHEPIVDFERRSEIIWWGYLDAAGISAVLCKVGVVIMHSRYEPGGRVVLEAMSQGVPVIATPYGFASELVEDWKTGFLVDFGDHNSLVVRMSHFIRQPLLRSVLGTDAKEVAQRALTHWDFIGTHCAVYEMATSHEEVDSTIGQSPRYPSKPSLFERRQVPSTFPLDDVVPSEAVIRAFVEKSTGGTAQHTERIVTGPGSSLRWRVRSQGSVWIVKWPYSRLNKSVMWDSFSFDTMFSSAQARYQRDYLSGSLPGFVPWDGADPEHLLLIRRESASMNFGSDSVAAAAQTYRKLETSVWNQPDFTNILKRDWRQASRENVLSALSDICQELDGKLWDLERLYSLRMAWRLMELDLKSGVIPRGFPVSEELFDSIHLFSELAESEVKQPVTIAHGSGDLEHCLRMVDGTLGLIDGEHIHPALAGEDLAALIYFAIKEDDLDSWGEHAWRAALEAAARNEDEWNRLLSWMGYLALDEARKAMTMMKPDSYETAIRTIGELTRLAKLRLNR